MNRSLPLVAVLFLAGSGHAQVRRLLAGSALANPNALALTSDGSHAVFVLDGSDEDALVSVPLARPGPAIQLAPRALSDSIRISTRSSDVYYRGGNISVQLLRQPADGSSPAIDLGVSLGSIHCFELSSDESRVALCARQFPLGPLALYCGATDGTGTPQQLSGSLSVSASMHSPPRFNADGTRIVFLAGTDSTHLSLYSVPSDGSAAPTLLQSGARAGVLGAPGPTVTSTGRVVFTRFGATELELWSTPTDGSSSPQALGLGIVLNEGPAAAISPDGAWVVYYARATVSEPLELFRVPVDGSAPAVSVLGPLVAGGSVRGMSLAGVLTRDSRSVVLLADAEVDERFELWSARLDGSQPPVKLSMPLPDSGDVTDDFELTHDAAPRVVFRADAGRDELFELYSVPAVGGEPPLRLHRSFQVFQHRDVFEFELSHDRRNVLYVANENSVLRRELHLVPSSGDRPPRLFDRPGSIFEPQALLTFYQERNGSVVFLRNPSGLVMRDLFGGRTTPVAVR